MSSLLPARAGEGCRSPGPWDAALRPTLLSHAAPHTLPGRVRRAQSPRGQPGVGSKDAERGGGGGDAGAPEKVLLTHHMR